MSPISAFGTQLKSVAELGAILLMVSVLAATQTRAGKLTFAFMAALAFGGVIR